MQDSQIKDAKALLEKHFGIKAPSHVEAEAHLRRRTLPPDGKTFQGREEEFATEISFSVWIAGEGMKRDHDEAEARRRASEEAEAKEKARVAESKARPEKEKAEAAKAARAAKKPAEKPEDETE